MSDHLTAAKEILGLRNRVDRLQAVLALRNQILAHLDDKDVSEEEIVRMMRIEVLNAFWEMMGVKRESDPEVSE